MTTETAESTETRTIAIEIDARMYESLASWAAHEGVSVEELAEEAVSSSIRDHEKILEGIREGIEDIRCGRYKEFRDSSEMFVHLKERLREKLRTAHDDLDL